MDLAEFFKTGFKNLQKDLIDKNYRKKSLKARKESLINARRQTRDTLRFNYRNIDPNHMSPFTPIPTTNKNKETAMNKEIKKDVINSKRLEMLQQWKEKKIKLKQEEKKHSKPIFKVFHIDKRIGLPDLEKVNKEIKGKPMKPLKTEFPKSFAPAHHKFVAPKHVQPINLKKTPMLDKPKLNKNSSNIPKSFAPTNHKFIAPKQVQPIHLNKQSSLDKQKVNTNTSNITRKILPRANTKMSVKSLPNITSNAKKNLPSTYAGVKKIQPSVISNKTKCLSDAGVRASARTAASANERRNVKKEKVSSKKTVKAKIAEEINKKESEIETQSEYKTPESQIKAPKDDYEPKSVGFKTPDTQFNTPNNENNAKLLSKRKGTPWLKTKDEGSNNSGENKLNEESVIIIDDSLDDLVESNDSEATMNTPTKKRASRRTPKYTPRPPSGRKSHANKDSCILCLDSPIKDAKSKTPTTRTKTPSTRSKTPTTKSKTPTTKSKTPTTKAETPKTKTLTPKAETPMTKTLKTKTKTPKSKRKSDKKIMATVAIDESEESVDNVIKTPDSVMRTSLYVSPFVTISRGKDSARKEYQVRKSTGGIFTTLTDGRDFTESTSPRAGAEYFEMILENEITKIETICEKWEKYKAENVLVEETSDMINVATGQSRLLIKKKFEQFRGLINQCKLCTFEEKPITCEDLHGFWDMIYHQVVDLGKRFDNLERLKNNNWEEILPEKKVIKKKVRGRPKKPAATSSLKEMIKAAKIKNKQQQQEDCQSLETDPRTPENMIIVSPIKVCSSRRSLRVSILQGPTLRRVSSPGLTMMKITQAIKAGDGLTPSKSILKTDLTKSAKRHTKSVLFVENFVPKQVIFSPEDKENNPKQANLNTSDEFLVNRRMSLRSSKSLSKA